MLPCCVLRMRMLPWQFLYFLSHFTLHPPFSSISSKKNVFCLLFSSVLDVVIFFGSCLMSLSFVSLSSCTICKSKYKLLTPWSLDFCWKFNITVLVCNMIVISPIFFTLLSYLFLNVADFILELFGGINFFVFISLLKFIGLLMNQAS